MTKPSSQHSIILKFQEIWPMEKLKTMSLEEYTNLEKTSFTYWLERETREVPLVLEYTGEVIRVRCIHERIA